MVNFGILLCRDRVLCYASLDFMNVYVSGFVLFAGKIVLVYNEMQWCYCLSFLVFVWETANF